MFQKKNKIRRKKKSYGFVSSSIYGKHTPEKYKMRNNKKIGLSLRTNQMLVFFFSPIFCSKKYVSKNRLEEQEQSNQTEMIYIKRAHSSPGFETQGQSFLIRNPNPKSQCPCFWSAFIKLKPQYIEPNLGPLIFM